jgi:hypothetical protein
MRVRYVVAAGVAAVVLTFLVVLLAPAPRLASSNSRVQVSANTVPIAPGKQRCQGGEYVPADAARLRIYPGGTKPGGPPLVLSVRDRAGRPVWQIAVPGGYDVFVPGRSYPSKPLDVRLPRARPTVELGQLCIRNTGRQVVAFAGNLRSLNPAAPGAVNGPGQRGGDEVRVDYYLSGERSALSIAPRVVDRAALFRPGFMGPWTIWLVLALFVATCAAAIVWIVRHLEKHA